MNGVVNVYKESGMTSFQVVAKVRRLFDTKKCGHTGTLDPMAEGVLPICLGHATRFADLLTATDKQYIAHFQMGASYDTFDTTGTVMDKSDIVPPIEEINSIFSSFIGNTSLKVPAFSAKKIDGKRAYELAREGKIQDAGFATMRIDAINLVTYDYPNGLFIVDCGKGTYVRSIIHEMGERTGAHAAMSGLIRSRSGAFLMKNACKLSDLEQMAKDGTLKDVVQRVQDVLPLQKAVVSAAALKKLSNGMSLRKEEYKSLPAMDIDEECLLVDSNGELLALGIFQGGSVPVKLSKVFYAE